MNPNELYFTVVGSVSDKNPYKNNKEGKYVDLDIVDTGSDTYTNTARNKLENERKE